MLQISTSEAVMNNLIEDIKIRLRSLDGTYVSPSAYDTAWVARIPAADVHTEPMYPQCLDWIQDNQLADGSWGSSEVLYYHDRILSTLNCIATLRRWNLAPEQVHAGEDFIRQNLPNLAHDAYATVGFELIFPVLLAIAQILDIDLPYDSPIIAEIDERRNIKLSKIPIELVYQRPTTILHSLEGLAGLIDFERIFDRQAENGSFLNSPSSTAFIYINTEDPRCLRYINDLLQRFGDHVPVNYPLDIFERLWVLNDIYFLRLEDHFQDEIHMLLQDIEECWTDRGMPWSRYVTTPDIDDTAAAFRIFRLNGRPVSGDVFKKFYESSTFFCFPGELDSSVSHILNLYEASRLRFEDENILHVAADYCRDYMQRQLQNGYVADKWVIRPDFKSLIEYALSLDSIYSPPMHERKNQIALYESTFLDSHWIDKTIYYVPNINRPDLLELAQREREALLENYEGEFEILSDWVSGHPAINEKRILSNMFISTNVYMQPVQRTARIIFSRTNMATFGTDDIYDSNEIAEADLMRFANALSTHDRSLLEDFPAGTLRDNIEDLMNIIQSIIEDVCALQGRDVSRHLRQVYTDTAEANRQETINKHRNYIPNFEEYMDYASITIGAPIAMVVGLYCLAELSDEFVNSPEYEEIVDTVSRLIRILNDIQTYARELEEGKINSIGILMHQGMSEANAVAHLHEYYRAGMNRLHRQWLDAVSLKPIYRYAYDLCRTTAWFYSSNDFHDFDEQMLYP